MKINVGHELLDIIEAIHRESKTAAEWAEIESDDGFQSEHFVGGYDACENAFCFSYYDDGRREYWFQFTLDEARRLLDGAVDEIDTRPAE